MPRFTSKIALASAAVGTLLAGCVAGPAPANRITSVYAPGQAAWDGSHQPQGDWIETAPVGRGAPTCEWSIPRELDHYKRVAPGIFLDRNTPLGPGDRLDVGILGDEDRITGTYVIDSDGTVSLRGLPPVKAAGKTTSGLTQDLRAQLIGSGMVRPLSNAVRVALIENAGVAVSVGGAVFEPGFVMVGERSSESRIGLKEGKVSGDNNTARTISTAIRAGGGVRPDADVQRVYLIRGQSYAEFDLSGFIHGWASRDVALASGDRIIVPSRKCFDQQLVRPSPLTQPGIRVFMSNLTETATSNSSAAINEYSTSLPYGTRLLQGLVSANCVGGSYMKSDRRAVLISRNRMNGQSIVIERDIEKLVRNANRDALNPYLMPGDAIACYDSRWTNFREAVGLVTDAFNTVTPAIILDNAL
ncbi:MAG: polysaccharide biosynthesis/export family protein [Pseudomonadota bacterium]